MADRFIAREDDVLDLETGVRYSTVNDSEVVVDLLNSLAAPEPVSGGVEVAAREALELAEEAMTYVSDYFREKWDMDARRDKIAAALKSSPSLEGSGDAVVLEGEFRFSDVQFFFLDDATLKGVDLYNAGANRWAKRDREHYDFGRCRLTITPIKERGDA